MKKKELKELATRIIVCEDIIETNDDEKEVEKAKKEILKLTKKIESLGDMLELDAFIQEQLENKT